MNRFFIAFLLASFFSSATYAVCYSGTTRYGPDILIDLSDKLSERNSVWETTVSSDLGLFSFNCTSDATFEYNFPASDRSRVIAVGLNDGKYWIRIEVINPLRERTLRRGGHVSSELNTPFTLRFTLMNSGDSRLKVSGNTGKFSNIMITRDTSGMTFGESIGAAGAYVVKVIAWVASFFQNWPLDQRDMFSQNLIVTYTPKIATCNFNNAGLMVNLPKIGVEQLTKTPQPGYTPFTLNFSCSNLLANGSTDRAIDMFLSSNNLLPSDTSVLMDSTPGSAKGVGIKVAKRDTPNAPVAFSTSTLNRGSATSIFSAAAGAVVNSNFSVGMGAYYFPYNPTQLTSGEVRATATLNIVYQ